MHRSIRLVFVMGLLLTGINLVGPVITAKATGLSAGCASSNNHFYSGLSSLSIPSTTFNAGETLTITTSAPVTVTTTPPGTASGALTLFSFTFPSTGIYGFSSTPVSGSADYTIMCGVNVAGAPLPFFNDGRINHEDAAQSAAIYCDDGGVIVYAVTKGVGTFAFRVSKAALANVPAKPAVNTLIASALGVRLYRLTSGEFQVNAATTEPPKEYIFRWVSCDPVIE